ncbi:MAG: hypothetical protein ACYC21_02955 [Eubacteriales bacterium]
MADKSRTSEGANVIFGIFPEKKYLTEDFSTYYTSNETFSGSLYLKNPTRLKRQYALIALLDNKQCSFLLNGENNKYFIKQLGPHEYKGFEFKLTGLERGEHDLIVFYIADPFKMNFKL